MFAHQASRAHSQKRQSRRWLGKEIGKDGKTIANWLNRYRHGKNAGAAAKSQRSTSAQPQNGSAELKKKTTIAKAEGILEPTELTENQIASSRKMVKKLDR